MAMTDSTESPQMLAWGQALISLLQRRFGLQDEYIPLIQRLVQAQAEGHVCLPLDEASCEKLRPQAGQSTWLGQNGDRCPLILDRQRLYLYRHHRDECLIAARLLQRQGLRGEWPPEILPWFSRLFPQMEAGQPQHEQWLATAATLLQPFSLIIGGPGTGKTTVVTRILALLQLQAPETRILLAAPTGKAAARLNESIRAGQARLKTDFPDLPVEAVAPAQTLHRLMGAGARGFAHNRQQPLHCDTLILDEASMIDQYLMARLCEALPDHARLILLGDAQQLAAVEAGSVLADIAQLRAGDGYSPHFCQRFSQAALPVPDALEQPLLADHVHVLRHSWRFDQHSAVGQLARAIVQGDITALQQTLAQHTEALNNLQPEQLNGWVKQAYGPVLAAENVEQALAQYETYRLLAVHRKGEWGLEALTAITARQLGFEADSNGHWTPAHGMPFLIRSNDPESRLFNGDTGLFWLKEGQLRACLRDDDGGIRCLHPARMPRWEPGWVMTVHQSQGSEFEQVLLALPGQPSPLLNRELLYTAVTRSKNTCAFVGAMERLAEALPQRTQRHSGLTLRLRAMDVDG